MRFVITECWQTSIDRPRFKKEFRTAETLNSIGRCGRVQDMHLLPRPPPAVRIEKSLSETAATHMNRPERNLHKQHLQLKSHPPITLYHLNWATLSLVFAGNLIVATLAWFVVGLMMPN
jgi:hypothetical protein